MVDTDARAHNAQADVDTADITARERAARRAAEALARGAREDISVAPEGQTHGEAAAHVAAERWIAADVAWKIAERARRLAATRQRAAEEALRLRTETLAAVAHDLRTPLTSLAGRAALARGRLARATDLNPDRAWLTRQVDEIDAATTRLRAAIDELDDAAHLAAGRELALAREPVDLGELARAVAREFALQRAVAVEAPDAPLLVAGDRARLDRALQNLIGNAIKYSPPASPVVVTVTRGVAAGVIVVRDRGVGIPAAELPHIFERSYRAATARGIAGSGLGLAGAKAIAERHGGTITAESAENTGTTVTVTLPLDPDAADAPAGA